MEKEIKRVCIWCGAKVGTPPFAQRMVFTASQGACDVCGREYTTDANNYNAKQYESNIRDSVRVRCVRDNDKRQ